LSICRVVNEQIKWRDLQMSGAIGQILAFWLLANGWRKFSPISK
jgi:hypothetical protein